MKVQKNTDIRKAAKEANVKLWEIAFEMNLADSNFSKSLRVELTQEKKEEIYLIINKLKVEQRAVV